jgi:hypothetical protein
MKIYFVGGGEPKYSNQLRKSGVLYRMFSYALDPKNQCRRVLHIWKKIKKIKRKKK